MNDKMKRIILAGGSGFLGRALAAHFLDLGWDVVTLTRSQQPSGGIGRQVTWDGCTLSSWQKELEGAAAVVNLTGKSVDCRYTARNRKEILDSRIKPTRVLGEAIRLCPQPPQVWLNASTATIYKHTFAGPWDESGEIGAAPEAKDEFSVEVARAWEQPFDEAQTPGTRKIAMRTTMVLGMGTNSVFPVLRRLVRLGLGGKMGSGRQFVSWMHQVDFCRAVEWLITHDNIQGPVNLAAPNPLPNQEMMKTLRQVCRVPIGLPATNWMLEVGAFFLRTETELIIKSRRVVPRRLIDSGFQFQFPTIREAFEDLSNRGT
ncbi:TIGR01777 family oxidoreductase [Pedosphaera parvula]|uniref:NAD-dependent epimerase/dehydratase n=1 Tax=Pedosphaera parvula (strain Ellin514) TaxID=320771 RepID=B9XGW9_PEDPL|nr:TIGR01777 family oxidoreductase [Pedosphaera parvula]EEF60890.1 NAD-dependent epimerase/dehydratase [Pedosphaera parvula Ellin514]